MWIAICKLILDIEMHIGEYWKLQHDDRILFVLAA
jgi:hypothetical protein